MGCLKQPVKNKILYLKYQQLMRTHLLLFHNRILVQQSGHLIINSQIPSGLPRHST